ncbi:MAG: hypothetical protein ACRD2O_13385, partial [Terriglobia bacterium]
MRLRSLSLVVVMLAVAATALLYHAPHLNRLSGRPLSSSAAAPQSAVSRPALIDGARHPELVPDLVAYRLFFVTVAEPAQPTAEQKARQRAQLLTAGLKQDDLQHASSVLATFKAEYGDLVERYDESVDVANRSGKAPDLQRFLSQQDALVQATREALAG